MSEFASLITDWQLHHGRHHLPWQGTRDPYRIWVSEIMLQQTQVITVLDYYPRFMTRFPTVQALASAEEEDVLALWSGLGYYSRARHLHQAARQMAETGVPRTPEGWQALPGVGRSTAAAILVFAYGDRHPILDGNVKRVLARAFACEGFPGSPGVERELWTLAESLLPEDRLEPYIQGLMDLGATICTRRRPQCPVCPVQSLCRAFAMDAIGRYPAARPARPVRERTFRMLLLRHEGRLFMERRGSGGIWGGLWSFPEMGMEGSPEHFVREQWGLEGVVSKRHPPLQHVLTHRRFVIHPVEMEVRTEGGGPSRWCSPEDALDLALPAPVRHLVEHLSVRRD